MIDKFELKLDLPVILNKCISKSNTFIKKSIDVPGDPYLSNTTHSYFSIDPDNHPHNWSELTPLIDEIKKRTNKSVMHSWFNVMSFSGEIIQHTHPNAKLFVCICYIEVTENHKPIEFFIKNRWIKMYPKPGDCFIFSKDIPHRVGKQTTHQLRCNINLEI